MRRRAIRRRRATAGLLLGLVVVGLGYLASGLGGPQRHAQRSATAKPARPAPVAQAPFKVRELDATYVDATRSVSLPNGARMPRRLVTRILYPVAGAGQRLPAPFPLIVFGHGYALYPRVYWPLLVAWARAGYVVAAPVFPLENAGAPGGPSQADLSNQPADMSFVISRVLAADVAASSPLRGLVDGNAIAVAGHSDGGDSALAVAEGSNRDHRVGAAVVMAGAELPAGQLDSGGPPLLALQGTADTVNPSADTDAFYAALAKPKFLVRLLGAVHTAPFVRQQPQLSVVEKVTVAFLDRYLKGDQNASARLTAAGTLPGVAETLSDS
jgi:dienelactone hydrolase